MTHLKDIHFNKPQDSEFARQKSKDMKDWCKHFPRHLTLIGEVELTDPVNNATMTQTAYQCSCGKVIYE